MLCVLVLRVIKPVSVELDSFVTQHPLEMIWTTSDFSFRVTLVPVFRGVVVSHRSLTC
jgi:hypothetical protein